MSHVYSVALERLPNQVLHRILRQTRDKGGKSALPLFLVCKAWNEVLGPVIGSSISINNDRLASFVRTIQESNGTLRQLKHLSVALTLPLPDECACPDKPCGISMPPPNDSAENHHVRHHDEESEKTSMQQDLKKLAHLIRVCVALAFSIGRFFDKLMLYRDRQV